MKPPAAPAKPVHLAKHVNERGDASALCSRTRKPIDLQRATWTNRHSAVTCRHCLREIRRLMPDTGKPSAPPDPRNLRVLAIATLDSAHAAMTTAAGRLEALGATGARKATELRGAAAVIQDGWIPELRKEPTTDA
jgi:hypothetical protein